MSVVPGGAFEIALYDQNFFANACNDDLLIRPMLSRQRVLIGTNSNQQAAISLSSNNVAIFNYLGVGAPLGNIQEALDIRGNIKASSNIYSSSKVSIGSSSNPVVSLEVNTTDSMLIPKGTTAQRPVAPVQGYVRYNTTLNTFEGYGAGNTWGSLGGVKDTNQDTYITPESFPTSNDDILRFINSNIETMRITRNGFIGMSNQSPSERLDLAGGNAKFGSNVYVLSRLAVASSNPLVSFEVNTNDAMLVPKGTSAQRPASSVQGYIRYNTTLNTFEGYGAGNTWGSLGGVKDTNQDTYIIPESFPTSNDDILRFINSNVETMRIMPTGFIGMSNQSPGERLDIAGGNAKFGSNVYVMSRLSIASSNPSVSLEVNTTDSILIPKGTTAQRPSIPVQGYVRYNTTLNTFEGYGAGNTWGSLGGVKDTNQDTYITPESFPSSNDDILRFINSNVETMRIMPNGFIGMSNQSPGERLDISGGNAKFGSNIYIGSRIGVGTSNPSNMIHIEYPTISTFTNSNAIYIYNPNNAANQDAGMMIRTAGTSAGNPYISLSMLNRGGWAVGGENQDAGKFKIKRGPLFSGNSDNTFVIDATSGFIGVALSNPVEQLDVNGNVRVARNMYVLSNLGIGTTTPSLPLEVNGSAKVNSNLEVVGNLTIRGNTTIIDATTVNVADNMITLNNGAAFNATLQSGIEINRGTGYSKYYFVFDEQSDYFKIGMQNSLQAVATRDDTIASGAIAYFDGVNQKYTGSNTFIYSSGNIGIGTSTPSESLDVLRNIKVNSNAYILNSLGVGKSNPSYPLDIVGTAAVDGIVTSSKYVLSRGVQVKKRLAPYFSATSLVTSIVYGFSNDENGVVLSMNGSNATNYFKFMAGTSEVFRVTGNGNVGVGNSNPSEKLHVSGKVLASAGWAGTGSTAGLLGGTVMNIYCERNGTSIVGDRLAWGNGSGLNTGLKMPFSGKIHYATLNVTTLTTGTLTFSIRRTTEAGVSIISSSPYTISVSNTAGATADWRTSPFTFAAGDRICCECTANTSDGSIIIMGLWYSFD